MDENSRVDRRVKRTVETSRSTTPVAVERSSPESTELVALFEKSSTLSLSPDLGLQGFEDDIFTSYLLSHFLAGWVMFPEVPWLRLHAEEVSSRSAKVCIRALGSVYFGRVHHQKYITDRGNKLYGQALIALNDDLRTEEKAWSVPVVRSAMVLELYEVRRLIQRSHTNLRHTVHSLRVNFRLDETRRGSRSTHPAPWTTSTSDRSRKDASRRKPCDDSVGMPDQAKAMFSRTSRLEDHSVG